MPNIILLSADSMRADHLGCYGYPLATSPYMDQIADQGVVCEKMFCPVIPTQPSYTTLYTGQHPITHGVVAHGGKAKLAREAPMLPEVLVEAGYTTCAVDTLLRERKWFARGYEYIIDPSIRHIFYAAVTREELNARAIHWMNTVPKGPFFLFVHYWDPHYPYVPPSDYQDFYDGKNPFDPDNKALDGWWDHPIGAMAKDTWLRTEKGLVTDSDYVRALYDREIRYFDDGLKALDDTLEQLCIADNTIVVITADHGESMTEHGVFFDHYGLYDCTLRVPFIIRWPGGEIQKGVQLPDMLQLSDVAPTLLDAAGIRIPSAMEGRSFLNLLTGEQEKGGYDRIVSLESTWQAKWCIRTERYKFILAREPDLLGNPLRELYDLEKDPQELDNIAMTQPELMDSFEKELEEWISDRLKALGKSIDPVIEEGASMAATWKKHIS